MTNTTTKTIEANALQRFNSGYNCAQSVVSSYADFFEIDNNTALNIAAGFGAGMGRLQETCGAVTGAYMVIGLYCGKQMQHQPERVEKCYAMVKQFKKEFVAIKSSTDCRLLLNCDLNTTDGKSQFEVNRLKQTICESCIKTAIRLLNAQM